MAAGDSARAKPSIPGGRRSAIMAVGKRNKQAAAKPAASPTTTLRHLWLAGLGLAAVARREALAGAGRAAGQVEALQRRVREAASDARGNVVDGIENVRGQVEPKVVQFSAEVEAAGAGARQARPEGRKPRAQRKGRKPAAKSKAPAARRAPRKPAARAQGLSVRNRNENRAPRGALFVCRPAVPRAGLSRRNRTSARTCAAGPRRSSPARPG
ncbi:hypothetical protein FE772_14995 [Lysobacter enzymogenes]|nr:hypothetical protein [Lysobacter enzymogenes]QCW26760.1 hypothetical protein FE772_14995 [Lysobacter enzymogenes]